jgi:hypothetical protein
VNPYSLSHLSDSVLLRDLGTLVARDRTITATLLAHLAEMDARKLYVPAAYSSMYAYCVGELRLSEEAAFKRIHAARTARRFPAIFGAVADGRLHLSAVVLLAPHLTPENVDELLAAAGRKTKSEIEHLIAERFPRPDVPTRVQALRGSPQFGETAPQVEVTIGQHAAAHVEAPTHQHAPGRVDHQEARHVVTLGMPSKVAPLSPQRFALQVTIDQSTHDKLRHAQALLGHQIPSGDVAQVLDRALEELILKLEKQKFAATDRPRHGQRRPSAGGRYVPSDVKRAVWQRDGARCTFVSPEGRRCEARRLLEFDHVEPVARGGEATLKGMRLRCRAHNQYAAECTFGTAFMSRKREEARNGAEAWGQAAASG